MNIAPICPILRPAMSATHLVNNLPGKRRRREPRPRHRPLPILIHKPRHGSPSIHLPTTNSALRFATIGSKFHLPKLNNLPVQAPRTVRAEPLPETSLMRSICNAKQGRVTHQTHTPKSLTSLDNRRHNRPTAQNRNVWPKTPSTNCEV